MISGQPPRCAAKYDTVRPWSRWLEPVVLALAVVTGGCGATVKEAARTATPEVVEQTIEEAKEPDNRHDIALIINDPRVAEASQSLATAIASGAVMGFTEPEHAERIGKFSEQLAVQVSSSLAKSMSSELGPQISRIASQTVQQTLDETLERILSTETEQRVTEFTRTLTQAIVQGMTQELTTQSDGSSGESAANLAAPAGGDRVTGPTSGVSMLARQVGHGAALGFQDAVRETELRRRNGGERPGDVLALPSYLADVSTGTLPRLGVALALFGLAIIVALAWALVRARRTNHDSRAREELLTLLASTLRATEGTPAGAELRDRLREREREPVAPSRDFRPAR